MDEGLTKARGKKGKGRRKSAILRRTDLGRHVLSRKGKRDQRVRQRVLRLHNHRNKTAGLTLLP